MANEMKVTREGYERLVEELKYLKEVKRVEVVEAIATAKSFGDLSENSEYDEAKTEQSKVEGRILELEELLRTVVIISDDQIKTDVINVGSVVTVYNETRKLESVYSIVGATEADPLNGKISDHSPIGAALVGKKVNDKVVAETPGGSVHLTILGISK
jgi:transcription elongation factor GreA